ncbi:sugar ABC transporter substrate-binding protein [Eubacteriales bacterium OttesenSCG-928-K08]|nr:sugar ABC transporter substrate-binding protein [Eubacteriales bacterium OttesenSCG-928-K08]
MKRILSLCLAAMLLLGTLVGCAPKEVAPVGNEADISGYDLNDFDQWCEAMKKLYSGSSVTIAAASHPSTTAFRAISAEFTEKTGIEIVWDEMQEGSLQQKLLMEGGASAYDVVMTCPEFIPSQVEMGGLLELDDFINDKSLVPAWFDYEDLMEAYRLMLTYGGKQYAVPFAGETVFLMYRADVFEELNLTVPETMEQMRQTAMELKQLKPDSAGMSMRLQLGWEFCYMYSCFMFPFGGRFMDPETNKMDMNSNGNRDALEYINSLLPYGPAGIENYSFEEAWSAFMSGDALMMVEASAAAPEIENAEKSVAAGKTGYAKMPAGPAGAYSGVWGWGFGITSSSKNKDAAWAVIAYLTSKQKQNEYVANGGIVSRASMLMDEGEQAKYPYYSAIIETLEQAAALQAQGYGVVLPLPEWAGISDVVGTVGARALVGEISVDEALESMQSQTESMFAN